MTTDNGDQFELVKYTGKDILGDSLYIIGQEGETKWLLKITDGVVDKILDFKVLPDGVLGSPCGIIGVWGDKLYAYGTLPSNSDGVLTMGLGYFRVDFF